jgi:hypothetical protein
MPDSPNAPTPEQLMRVMRSLMRMTAIALIENAATQAAIVLVAPDVIQAIGPAREAIRKQWQPILDSLAESTPESLEDIFQRFEGPIQ